MIGLLYNGPIKSNIHLKGTGMNTDNIFDNVSPKTTNHTVSIEFALPWLNVKYGLELLVQ